MVHYSDDVEREYEEGEADDIDTTEGDALHKIKDLKEKLKACEKERKDYLDGWQRSKADYLNSKKRYDEERGQLTERAEDALIEKILPLCDSFDMAETHKDEGAWSNGWSQVHNQLKALLASFGVVEVDALGKPFDPRLHEALKTETVDDSTKRDHVIVVLQKGYIRNGRLIRPAKVVIGN